MKTIIVGGVAGGASAAARLRRLDESAEIVLFEKGEFISYANCGLPYYIGGVILDEEELTLQTPHSFKARFNVDVRVNSEVMQVDTKQKQVVVQAGGRAYRENYDTLLLSPGAKPILPSIQGVDLPGVFTLRTIPDTLAITTFIKEQKAKRALVVGGGYIGIEMAENLVEAGLSVTVVEMSHHVIAPLDADMVVGVQRHLAQKGVQLLLNQGVRCIAQSGGGLNVQVEESYIEADIVILAVGVRPDTAFLEGSGITLNTRGAIVVDEHMQTSYAGVYAVGDAVQVVDFVTGQQAMIPLAGPANKQGRIAADNIAGVLSRYKGTQGSAILKVFDLTVATTGANERVAKAAGIDCDKVYIYPHNHAGYYPGGSVLAMKILFARETGRILGGQMVGAAGADKRCDVLATAIRFGATADDLTELELCYAPPYSSAKDPLNMAGYVIQNILSGYVKQFHWHEVDTLPRDGSVQLVDARTAEEFAKGSINGFINFPLEEIRHNLYKLDKSKPIYIHCQSGMRSYVASRMLAENGYDVYNLAGGYLLYKTATSAGYAQP